MFHFRVSSFAFSPSTCAPIGSAEPPTNTFLVAWPAHNLLIALPALPTHTLFGLHRLLHFCQFTYIFEFEHVCICFIPLFHIFPSQCAPIGSLERPWTTTQKGWSHYLDVQRATLVPICLSAYIHVCSALPYKIHLTQVRFN